MTRRLKIVLLLGALGVEYVRGFPLVWRPTEIGLDRHGSSLAGRVYERDGRYLVDLSSEPDGGCFVVDPESEEAYDGGGGPLHLLGAARTRSLGVRLTEDGKAEAFPRFDRTSRGVRIRIFRHHDLPGPQGGHRIGLDDEFELVPAPAVRGVSEG